GRIAAWPRIVDTISDGLSGVEYREIPSWIDILIGIIWIFGTLVSVFEKQVVNRFYHRTTPDRSGRIAKAVVGIPSYCILSVEDHLAGVLAFIPEQAAVIGV